MPTITDWLMVVITFVYVVATILICIFNFRSTKATREQVVEAKRQYEGINRPYITCEYILENRLICGIRICNHGNMVAKDLTFLICKDFLDALQPNYYDFRKLNESQYRLVGIRQKFDFFFSDVNHKPEVPFELTIHYRSERSETDFFHETFCFDLAKQTPIYSVNTIEEKILEISKKQQNSLDNIASSLQKIAVSFDKVEGQE